MNIRFISDLHFEHTNIGKWRGIENHDEWLIEQWNSVVKPQDLVWVLGDVAFRRKGLKKVKHLNGTKHLILGNHDTYPLKDYLEYFNKIHGFMKYKGFWLSHCPISAGHLRGLKNIHGHTHSSNMFVADYVCVCVEAVNGKPITLEEIQETAWTHQAG